jgi:tRNA pseudouridine13 synthase
MKLRRLPEDFRVEELSDLSPGEGPYALYVLTKRSLGTPECVAAIAQRWRVPEDRLSFGGLKDKHAVTRQFVTIRGGPRRNLQQEHFELGYQGQVDRPFDSESVAGNRFQIVLRRLPAIAAEQAAAAVHEIRSQGMPNYFDSQRFGSVGESGQFVAQPWCLGDYERTIWLAIAEFNARDRPRDREEKQRLQDRWGQWPALRASIRGKVRREAVAHLAARPGDFRGAIARIPAGLRSLYLNSFQSHLWNAMLARYLAERCPAESLFRVPVDRQRVSFFRRLPGVLGRELLAATLPLPSARLHLPEGPERTLAESAAAEAGLELRQLRVKYPRDSFFSKGDRSVLVLPRNASSEAAEDELYPGSTKLTVRFDLPRGAYATILVKRLQHGHEAAPAS